MEISVLIAGIDEQIKKLQQARAVLAGVTTTPIAAAKSGRGRPKGSKNVTTATTTVAVASSATTRKRKLSPEGRKRIADAMKRRWAERRKTATKTAAK